MNVFHRLHALLYTATGLLRWEGWHAFPYALRGLWSILKLSLGLGRVASPELVSARIKTCEACPIFFARHRTCGDAHQPDPDLLVTDPDTGKLVPMGCLCLVDIKAQVPESNCWAWEKELPNFGWQGPLNGGYTF